jgi:hypothetical protein
MKKYFLFLILFFKIYSFCIAEDTILIRWGEWIENYNINRICDKIILKNNIKFDGFLIINIDKILNFHDSTEEIPYPLPFQIYWINNINEIDEMNSFYWYFYDIIYFINSKNYLIDKNSEMYYFLKYYELIFYNLDKECHPPLYDIFAQAIYTSYIENLKIWQKNNHFYIILNCSFQAVVIKLLNENYNKISGNNFINTIIPISKYYEFKESDVNFLKNNNFILTSKIIKTYKVK